MVGAVGGDGGGCSSCTIYCVGIKMKFGEVFLMTMSGIIAASL